MKIKCGRRVFEVSSKDRVLDNGAVYILITQTYHQDYSNANPIISKTLFKRLKKDGKIRLSKEKYISAYSKNHEMDLYEFVDDDLQEAGADAAAAAMMPGA